MPQLTLEDVDRIARLCRLSLTDERRSAMLEQLYRILDYVAKLQKLNTNSIEPTNQVTDQVNVSRSDLVREQDAETVNNMLHAAPAVENRGITVPPVL